VANKEKSIKEKGTVIRKEELYDGRKKERKKKE